MEGIHLSHGRKKSASRSVRRLTVKPFIGNTKETEQCAGDWKLVAKGARGKWELYNMAKDRSEQTDLSEKMPGRTRELAAMWQAYAERAHVLNPRGNNRQNGGKNQTKK